MPEPTATKPIPRDIPKPAPTRSAKTPRATSEVISATDVSIEVREDARSPSEDQIRSRAYQIYVETGYGDGGATEHWLAAERELLVESTLYDRQSFSQKFSVVHAKRNDKP
jgi:hypothetical protein